MCIENSELHSYSNSKACVLWLKFIFACPYLYRHRAISQYNIDSFKFTQIISKIISAIPIIVWSFNTHLPPERVCLNNKLNKSQYESLHLRKLWFAEHYNLLLVNENFHLSYLFIYFFHHSTRPSANWVWEWL